MTTVTCVQSANAILGESPCWDAAQQVLYWVDGKRPAIFCWDVEKGQTGHWPMPNAIGSVARALAEHLVFVDAEGFGLLDTSTGALTRIADPERELPHSVFNDGKVDRAGRFWAGSMDERGIEPNGALYRLDGDLSVHRMDTGFICSNGLGWSPDNRIMYFTDSIVRTIWAYEFDFESGALGKRRVFARLSDHDGLPDGLTVDSEGYVWSAIWDGWRVIRYTPDGDIDSEVRVPVQRPTSCSFGGADLKTLFITSACDELGAVALQSGPLAGALFSIHSKVPGLEERAFGA